MDTFLRTCSMSFQIQIWMRIFRISMWKVEAGITQMRRMLGLLMEQETNLMARLALRHHVQHGLKLEEMAMHRYHVRHFLGPVEQVGLFSGTQMIVTG